MSCVPTIYDYKSSSVACIYLYCNIQFDFNVSVFEIEIQKLKIQQENATEELTVNLDDVIIQVPLEALVAALNGN